MIVGIDVCHKVSKAKKSVLTFAATMNKYLSNFYVDYVTKGENQKINFPLAKLFENSIRKFKGINK